MAGSESEACRQTGRMIERQMLVLCLCPVVTIESRDVGETVIAGSILVSKSCSHARRTPIKLFPVLLSMIESIRNLQPLVPWFGFHYS